MPRRGGRSDPPAGRRRGPAGPAAGGNPGAEGSGPTDGLVRVGEFGRAHALSGEVRLKSFTGDPLAIGGYGPLLAADGRSFTIGKLRPAPGEAPDLLIARVDGVATREAAEALTRVALFVPRDRLAPPEDADEFYLVDLVGLAAVDPAGGPLGRVVGVPDFGGGPLLEVAPEAGGATVLVPFTRAFVPAVEVAGGRVVLDPGDLFARPARDAPEQP